MKIETKEGPPDEFGRNISYVSINGIDDLEGGLFREDKAIRVSKIELVEIISEHNFKELAGYFDKIFIPALDIDAPEQVEVTVCITLKDTGEYFDDLETPCINFSLSADIENWKKPWSITEYMEAFMEMPYQDEKFEFYIDYDNISYENFGFFAFINDYDDTLLLKHYLMILSLDIQQIIDECEQYLKKQIDKNSLVEYFYFPKEVKAPCQQYLLYFTQFLDDLGINSTATIQEINNEVVFKVTPKDKSQALSEIRILLGTYLNIQPEDQFLTQRNLQKDIAVLQWESNIHHLKAQLTLAAAVIQAKDAHIQLKEETIQSLKLTNYQLSKQLEPNKKDESPGSSNPEKILGGIIEINKLDTKGVSINLAEIYRKLKRRLGGL